MALRRWPMGLPWLAAELRDEPGGRAAAVDASRQAAAEDTWQRFAALPLD